MTLEAILGRGIPSWGGVEKRYACPLCVGAGKGADTKGHLYVNEVKGVYYCQRCGSQGPISFLKRILQIDDRGEIPPPTDEVFLRLQKALLGGLTIQEELRYPCEVVPIIPGSKGHIYLNGARGVSDWVIQEHKIVEGVHPQFGPRVFVPTFVDKKMAYWVGRSVDGAEPKYINPRIPKTCVFNLNNVPPGRPVIVCEGVFSAIACHPWAVALFGKTPVAAQLLALQRFSPPFYIVALDGDARRESERLAESLSGLGKPVRIVEIPMGEDPDSLPEGAIWRLPIRTYDSSYKMRESVKSLLSQNG